MRVNFWIATTVATNELWHWEHAADAWCDYTQAAGIGKRRLGLSFVEDRSGNLWIGTGSEENDAAMIRFRASQFQIFTEAEKRIISELAARFVR